MSRLECMHAQAASAPALTPYSCAEAWAAAMPPHTRVRAEFDRVMANPRWRVRCARQPILGARFVAYFAKCRAIPFATENRVAWGVADGGSGNVVFAYWTGAAWWARSKAGVCRVNPSRILRIWSVE